MVMHVALVDDWELRGDGSGDPRAIQFRPLRDLLALYEEFGFKATINAEIMQQIYHLKLGAEFPHLRKIAEEWSAAVLDTVRRGHDVQLHVHSQWHGARYTGERWELKSPWAITELPRETARQILVECKTYLEQLVRQVLPSYRCVSFRSGTWAIAPSDHILTELSDLGIRYDISIAKGLKYDNQVIKLDYSEVEEGTYPFYPDMRDARKLGRGSSIVCIPTLTFAPNRVAQMAHDVPKVIKAVARKIGRRIGKGGAAGRPSAAPAGADYGVWKQGANAGFAAKVVRRLKRELLVADLAQRSFWQMRDGLTALRKRISPRETIPVILENHTKDLPDLGEIRRLCEWFKAQPDIQVKTLAEIGSGIAAGTYPIRAAA